LDLDDKFNINLHEEKIYSQNGEDGILQFIFSKIGTTNRFFVEFGVENGLECNTRYLLEKKGWKGLMMDYSEEKQINLKYFLERAWYKRKLGFSEKIRKVKGSLKKITEYPKSAIQLEIKNEKVTAENIQGLFQKYNVPKNFDLLSIDIDYNDYWVWKSIVDYHPRVVVIEYNSSLLPTESRVVPYDPDARWDGTNYFGSSLLALYNLGLKKGYTLVGCDSKGINTFFVKNELVKGMKIKNLQDLYRPPKYGKIVNGRHIGHPPNNKEMIRI